MPVYSQSTPPESFHSIEEFNNSFARAKRALSGPASDLQTAQRLMDQALEWARANPGANHSDLVRALYGEGQVVALTKNFDKAIALYRDALATFDTWKVTDQGLLYELLRRILALSWRSNQADQVIDIAKRLSLLSGSQLQKDVLRFLAAPDTLPFGEFDGFQRLAQEPYDQAFRPVRGDLERIVATLINTPGTKTELAEAIITHKAVIQDAVAGLYVILSEQENHIPVVADALASYLRTWARDPPGRRLAPLDRLRANAAAMSRLAYADPHITPDRLPRPLQLQHERTDLERHFANAIRPNWKVESLESIRQALPENTVVLEYAIYAKPPTETEKGGESRYLLVALSSVGVQSVTDIGSVAKIDGMLATACRAILQDPEAAPQCSEQNSPEPSGTDALKSIGRELYNTLLGSVAKSLMNSANIIISPDGALNFFPFELLIDPEGKYLISSHLVSYIQSAREIPLWKSATISHGPPVIVADPDYGPDDTDDCSEPVRGPRRTLRAADDLKGFKRLCGTAQEAQAVREVLPDAVLLTRSTATEEAVKGIFAPRILHLSTHGFLAAKLNWPLPWFDKIWWDLDDYDVMNSDAMLRGGLIFAGANIRRSPGGLDDGLLSAREASLLNLNGTQLVVLSACDSGLGLTRAGDGVVGLRRAFALSGARAQTFSLWPVSDYPTVEFMRSYYRLLAEGRPNVEAIAQVKREFLARGTPWNEPWIWAAFVGYGFPGALGK